MLIGGRPLPERPFLVKVLTVCVFVMFALPLVPSAIPLMHLLIGPVFGEQKLTADETAAALNRRRPGRDAGCVEHRQSTDWTPVRDGAWDYICTYAVAPGTSTRRMKIGVRVGAGRIETTSRPHELDAQYIR